MKENKMKLKLVLILLILSFNLCNCCAFEEEFPYTFSKANGHIIGAKISSPDTLSKEELERLNRYRKLFFIDVTDHIFIRTIIPWDIAISNEENSGWMFKNLFSNSHLMLFYSRETLADGTVSENPTWSYSYLKQKAKRWINRWHENENLEKSLSMLTIFENNSSRIQPIGIIGLFVNNHQDLQASAIIDKNYQGKGIMKACIFRIMTLIATQGLELNCRIRVSVRPENLASRSLIENLGFLKDKESEEEDESNLLYYKSPTSAKEFASWLTNRSPRSGF